MPAPVTSEEFLQLLRKSGLFNAARFGTHFASEEDLPRDPHKCAAAFVSAGILTSYQAKLLLTGRYRGFVLGPYTLLQPIGKGGMGAVYLADHHALSRQVAIKVLPMEKSRDKLSLERFQREARAVAALDHPNIVKVFDICHSGGVHFLVLEHVDGVDLQSLIDNTGSIPCELAAKYIAQAAAGLSHAHQRGFVHRDVKPSNLMVTRDGQIKILDMGLARSYLDRRDNLTEQLGEGSDIAGTIDFCSPEHAVGQPVDARSDIYSLGATFCTLVTGKPPYSGTTAQKLLQHQMKAPPNLSLELKGSVPPELSMIVMKMMAKRKEDRFATAEELHAALTAWIPSTESHANKKATLAQTPPPVSKKADRAHHPYRNGVIAIGIALTVMIGGAIYSMMMPSKAKTNITARVETPSSVTDITPNATDNQANPTRTNPGSSATPPAPAEKPIIPSAKKPLAKIVQHIFFQAAGQNAFSEEFAGGTNTNTRELLTAPWAAGVWKMGSRGHVEVGNFEGIPAIILKNLDGPAAVQLYTLEPFFVQPENARAVVRIEYRTSGKASGNLQVRTAKSGTAASRRVVLPNTNKLWETVELELPAGESRPAFLCIQNSGPNNDALAVRSIQGEVMESEGQNSKIDEQKETRLVYRLDMNKCKPMNIQRDHDKILTVNPGEMPSQWFTYTWHKDNQHEFFIEPRDGHMAIGLRQLSGSPGAMLCIDGINVKPNHRYDMQIQYMATGNFRPAEIRYRIPRAEKPVIAGQIGTTAGNWKSLSVPITSGDASTLQVEFLHNGPYGEGHELILRGIEIHESD